MAAHGTTHARISNPGRPKNARLRTMRFVMWAQRQSPEDLTPQLISGALDISLQMASAWRADWFEAISPINAGDLPAYQQPEEMFHDR